MIRSGPIEEYAWPEKLTANVVTPGAAPRVHGYDVEGDIARHYRFTDLVLLSLTGELPTEEVSEAFDVALQFLAPLSIAEGPTHAAALAKICGARASAITSTAAVGLAERARAVVAEHAGAVPVERELPGEPAVTPLREALLARGVKLPLLDAMPTRSAALIAVLHFCGLKKTEQIETAFVVASLATTVAEARTHTVASFRDYPMQLPPFEYEDP